LQGGVIDLAIIPGDFGDVIRRRLDLLVLLLTFGPRITDRRLLFWRSGLMA
jgi:hypothetical protein